MSNKPFEIECPDCRTTIVIDRETGQILWHKTPEATQKHNLDAMLSGLHSQKDEMARKFDREMESQKDRASILDKKFREAVERADKSDKPMKNPLDLD